MRDALRPQQPAVRHRARVGLAAFAAGAAAVAVLAATGTAYADPPSTVPTNVVVTGSSGVVTVTADSTAAQVAFQVDDAPGRTASDVVSGTATYQWPSWGYPNGTHTVTAYDCDNGDCNATGTTSDPFTLTNTAPDVTAPQDGAEIASTGFTLAATSDSETVEFRIDGASAGTATAADSFTTTYSGPTLPEGPHTIIAVQCTADASLCSGPESDQASVMVVKLHPKITAITPNPFSPNGNGVKDRAKVNYTLSHDGSADVVVVSPAGAKVRTVHVDSASAGAHSWVWDGKTDGGTRVQDGTYRVSLITSADVSGVTVQGTATGSVRVDSTAPSLASASGGGTTFYPYPDRYEDSFKPAVTLGERGTLRLIVQNSAGHIVRTIAAYESPGRRSLTWNGRNSANRIVPAGKYHWTFTATDAAGNTRASLRQLVSVSSKRLVKKTKNVTIDGSSYYATQRLGPIRGCSSVSKANSSFGHGGVLVSNECRGSKHSGVMATFHRLKLPGAIKYGGAKMRVYGFTHAGHLPSLLGMIVYNTKTSAWEAAKHAGAVVRSTGKSWRTVGNFALTDHITARHLVFVSFGVLNAYGPADFDMRYLRLTVACYVLQ